MFQTDFLSIIRSLRLCIQHQVYVIQVQWLLPSRNEFHLIPDSKQSEESVWHTPDAVCTVLDSWWWTERPSETCRVLLRDKINLKTGAARWFYYRKVQNFLGPVICMSPFIVCGHVHTNSGRQGTTASKFCSVEPSICGSSLCALLHVPRLTPRILRWRLDFFFWKSGYPFCT
jgi:hypothetical protein